MSHGVQQENNAFQCPPSVEGDPDACGHAASNTGYGCFIKQMIESWRKAWSTTPSASTDSLFPFGIVSLAGGTSEGDSPRQLVRIPTCTGGCCQLVDGCRRRTSEGHAWAMPAFRNAQTAGGGLLPSATMPATFVAQAFDAAEPAGGDLGDGNACALNDMTLEGGYPCRPGFAGYTPSFMGGIHPRAKRVVGLRLAAAARNLVYNDPTVAFTGPVLSGCRMLPGAPRRRPVPRCPVPRPVPRKCASQLCLACRGVGHMQAEAASKCDC